MSGRSSGPGRPDHTRVKVSRAEGDVRIPPHDLVGDGDFVIPDDAPDQEEPPFIGGGTRSILAVESTEDTPQNFSIKFEYGFLDADGDFQVDYVYDKSKDANMDGDSDYFIRIDPVRDRVRVTITDESNASSNSIRGGLNSS